MVAHLPRASRMMRRSASSSPKSFRPRSHFCSCTRSIFVCPGFVKQPPPNYVQLRYHFWRTPWSQQRPSTSHIPRGNAAVLPAVESHDNSHFVVDGRGIAIVAPILWSIGGIVCIYGVCAYYAAKRDKTLANRTVTVQQLNPADGNIMQSSFRFDDSPTWEQIEDMKRTIGASASDRLFGHAMDADVKRDGLSLPTWMAEIYYSESSAMQLTYAVIGCNVLVFGLWQIKHLAIYRFMARHFLHRPHPSPFKRPYTLLTSVFSHSSLLHISMNMWTLYHFLPFAATLPQFVQNTPHHVLAFYLSSGILTSLAQQVGGGLRFGRATATARIPGLGASGAIFACVGAVAACQPQALVHMFLVPIDIKLSTALGALMSVDLAGIILGWRFFAHWAHLGGALGGLAYVKLDATNNVWKPLQKKMYEMMSPKIHPG